MAHNAATATFQRGYPGSGRQHLRVAGRTKSRSRAPNIAQTGVGRLSCWACVAPPPQKRGRKAGQGEVPQPPPWEPKGERLGDNGPSWLGTEALSPPGGLGSLSELAPGACS